MCSASAFPGRILVGSLFAELKRIQISVLKNETQSDGFPGHLAEITPVPRNFPLGLISEDLWTIFERKAVDRLALGRLDLHLNAACGGRGEVQGQLASTHRDWSGDDFATG